jgi:hypothetical protein
MEVAAVEHQVRLRRTADQRRLGTVQAWSGYANRAILVSATAPTATITDHDSLLVEVDVRRHTLSLSTVRCHNALAMFSAVVYRILR